ncbi:MAG TPA: hypothetical protein VNT31_08575 [Nocardioides sp.]|nr:hypothetical protein [Nocardioides sp.]
MHKSLRRVVLMVVALVASSLSLVAVTSAPAQAAPTPTEAHLTRDYSVVKYGGYVTMQGWVTCCGDPEPGYGFKVQLQRKIGSGAWTVFSTRDVTSTTPRPVWKFKPSASAYYRLYFPGIGTEFAPDYSPALKVGVRRNLNDNWRSSTRTFYGKVAPKYAGKPVIIQKSTCRYPNSSSCSWSVHKVVYTNGYSNWAVRLPAYRTRTHFRAYVRPSSGYLGSLSNHYVTTYRY